jgi:hypothetical protein
MQTQAYMTLNIQLYTRKAWKTMKMPPYDGLIFSHHSIVEFLMVIKETPNYNTIDLWQRIARE